MIGTRNKNGQFVPADSEEVVVTSTKQDFSPEFTRWLIGTYIDPKTNEWMTIQVPFDPKTLQLGKLDVQRVAGNHEIMLERLQIKMGSLGLAEEGDFSAEQKTEIY